MGVACFQTPGRRRRRPGSEHVFRLNIGLARPRLEVITMHDALDHTTPGRDTTLDHAGGEASSTAPADSAYQVCPACALDGAEVNDTVGRRRAEQCRTWNADPDHQRLAGKGRAQQRSAAEQAIYALCSFSAQSARWRAAQGLPPLAVDHVKYLAPVHIRTIGGHPLSDELRAEILEAWRRGELYPVDCWLMGNPPVPPGSLWTNGDLNASTVIPSAAVGGPDNGADLGGSPKGDAQTEGHKYP